MWALRVMAGAGMACVWLSPVAMYEGHLLVGFVLTGIGSALLGCAIEVRA